MKTTAIALLAATLVTTPLAAGVVFEIETMDHSASPPRPGETSVSVEGPNIAMDVAPSEPGRPEGKVIYRGDRREMVVVDPEDQSYTVLDEETMAQLAARVGDAMAQMQKALENVPADKRAMVEEMMKRQMPQQAPERPKSELKKTSERATHSGYPCVKYEVYRDGRKLQELWVTDWSNVEGGTEVAGAFEGMADFFQEMLEAVPDSAQGPGWGGRSVFEHMGEMDGFPVVTRSFEGGELEDESTLRSARRRTLDPDEFEPPAGYKRRSMLGPP